MTIVTLVTVDSFVMSSRRPRGTTVAAVTLNASSPGALCFGVAAFNNSPFVQSLRAQMSARKQANIAQGGDQNEALPDYEKLIKQFISIVKENDYSAIREKVTEIMKMNKVSGEPNENEGRHLRIDQWENLSRYLIGVFQKGNNHEAFIDKVFSKVLFEYDKDRPQTMPALHKYIADKNALQHHTVLRVPPPGRRSVRGGGRAKRIEVTISNTSNTSDSRLFCNVLAPSARDHRGGGHPQCIVAWCTLLWCRGIQQLSLRAEPTRADVRAQAGQNRRPRPS